MADDEKKKQKPLTFAGKLPKSNFTFIKHTNIYP